MPEDLDQVCHWQARVGGRVRRHFSQDAKAREEHKGEAGDEEEGQGSDLDPKLQLLQLLQSEVEILAADFIAVERAAFKLRGVGGGAGAGGGQREPHPQRAMETLWRRSPVRANSSGPV